MICQCCTIYDFPPKSVNENITFAVWGNETCVRIQDRIAEMHKLPIDSITIGYTSDIRPELL